MLTENNKLEDKNQRIDCIISGWCAYDPQTGANLRRSNGRAKYGQRSKYWLYWDNHELKMFKAYSDSEAVEKAVKHMQAVQQNEEEAEQEARVDAMSL